MTIDEAIIHAEEKGKELLKKDSCNKCAEDHFQLASWLRELKILREKTEDDLK